MYPEIHFEWHHATYTYPIYPLFVMLSILIGYLLFEHQMRSFIVHWATRTLLFLLIAIHFLIGARLFNYLIRLNESPHVSLWSFKLNNFSLYGGIMLGTAASYALFRYHKLEIWKVYDRLAIPFLVAFSIMKMGCFLNGCCFGKLTKAFWGVPIPLREAAQFEAVSKGLPFFNATAYKVYPTQLMEAGAALLISLLLMYLKERYPGFRVLMAGILFSAARWIILYFRLLPYSNVVQYFLYPLFYGVLILTCMGIMRSKKIENAADL